MKEYEEKVKNKGVRFGREEKEKEQKVRKRKTRSK